jgi:hypothetical protein
MIEAALPVVRELLDHLQPVFGGSFLDLLALERDGLLLPVPRGMPVAGHGAVLRRAGLVRRLGALPPFLHVRPPAFRVARSGEAGRPLPLVGTGSSRIKQEFGRLAVAPACSDDLTDSF